MTTQDDAAMLDSLAALYAKATPGKWVASQDENGFEWGVDTDDGWGIATCADGAGDGTAEGNARLIAALHNALPRLLQLARIGVETLRAPIVEMMEQRDDVRMPENPSDVTWKNNFTTKRVRIVPVSESDHD